MSVTAGSEFASRRLVARELLCARWPARACRAPLPWRRLLACAARLARSISRVRVGSLSRAVGRTARLSVRSAVLACLSKGSDRCRDGAVGSAWVCPGPPPLKDRLHISKYYTHTTTYISIGGLDLRRVA